MASEVGSGQVSILPVFKGFRKAVSAEVDGSTTDAANRFQRGFRATGQNAGTTVGRGFKDTFTAQTRDVASAASSQIAAQVATAARAVSAARLKEQDAAGKLRLAETQLTEAQSKYAAGSSQVVRAEERAAASQRVLAAAQDTTKSASTGLAAAQQRLQEATQRAGSATASAAGGFGRVTSALTAAGRSGASGFTGAVGSMAGGLRSALGSVLSVAGGFALGSVLAGAVSRGLSAAKDAVFGFNSTLQSANIGFTTMLGSGQKAATFIGNLKDFAKATPFDFQSLVKYGQSMLGMGINANSVIPDLKALGDSVASVGGGTDQLNSVVLAFDQMNAKGTLDMGNIQQLAENGVPSALKILAAGFHTTTGGIIKMISTGKVASSQALPLLIKGIEQGTSATAALGGMMDKQSQTFTGALSNIGDGATQLLATAFKPLFDQTSAGLQGIATALGSDAVSRFAANFATGLTSALSVVGKLKSGVSDFITGFTKGTDAIGSKQSVLASWGAALFGILSQLGASFGPVLSQLGASFGPVLSQIAASFAPLGSLFASLAPQLVQLAASVSPVGLVLQAIAPLVPQLVGAFGQLAATLGAALGTALSALLPVLAQLSGVVVTVLGSVLGAVLPVIVQLAGILGPVLSAVIAALVPIISLVAQLFGQLLAAIAPLVSAILPILAPLLQLVAAILVPVVQLLAAILQPILGLVSVLVGVLIPVIQVLVTILSVVITAVANVLTWLVNLVTGAGTAGAQLGGIWAAIAAGVQAMVAAVGAFLAPLIGFFQTVFGAIGAFIGGAMTVIRDAILIPIGLIILVVRAQLAVLTPIFMAVFHALAPIVSGVFNTIRSVITGVLGFIRGYISAALNAYRAIFLAIFNALAPIVSGVFNTIRSVISGALSVIRGIVSSSLGAVRAVFAAVLGAIGGVVSSGVSRVVGFFRGIGSRIIGAIGSLASVGVHIIQGLVDGITGQVSSVVNAITGVASSAINAAKSLLGIHSPSKVFQQIGVFLVEGFVAGVTGSVSAVRSAMTKLQNQVISAFNAKGITRSTEASLLKVLQADNTKLVALANQRTSITAKISSAKQALSDALKTRNDYAASLSDSVTGLGNITGASATAASMIATLRNTVASAGRFTSDLASLQKLGLNTSSAKQLTDQFAQSGDTSFADALLAGGKGAVTQVNSLQGQLAKQAKSLGTVAANALYQAGVDSAQGLVDGLNASLSKVTAASVKIADSIVSTVKKRLGIHSPSSVAREELGQPFGDGFALGITDRMTTAQTAMKKLTTLPKLSTGADGVLAAPTVKQTVLNYHAAPNQSFDEEKDLLDFMRRKTVVLGNA